MKIPKTYKEDGQEYVFIEKCNNDLFLYKNKKYGYKRAFTTYELGLRTEMVEPPRYDLNVEHRRYRWRGKK